MTGMAAGSRRQGRPKGGWTEEDMAQWSDFTITSDRECHGHNYMSGEGLPVLSSKVLPSGRTPKEEEYSI